MCEAETNGYMEAGVCDMQVTRDPSVLLLDTLENYPLNEYFSPIHTPDPVRNVYNMMPQRVAVDFYLLSPSNTRSRFLCVEADVSGDSSDCGDVVMYGLAYQDKRWLATYRTLREMHEHEYIMLPHYPEGDTIAAALQLLR